MAIEGFLLLLDFFFSSRRRHTRSLCDWSSDVCSSDLVLDALVRGVATGEELAAEEQALGWFPRCHLGACQRVQIDAARFRIRGPRDGRPIRSEERRVGKECRSRGRAETTNKKKSEYTR